MQKAFNLSTPHLARSRTHKDLYKCMLVWERAHMCVCQNEGECMGEREREVCGIYFR